MADRLMRDKDALIGGDRFIIKRYLGGGAENKVYRVAGREGSDLP